MSQVRKSSNYQLTTRISVVIDNHKAHHTPKSIKHLANLNIEPLWMPTYSPEFNSIELLWAVVK